MSPVQVACPACAAPVQFRLSTTLVSVCEFCDSVVARTDRKLEDLGKVAEIAETGSPLQLDLRGKYEGKSLILVGRAQFRHEAGGIWDEWYVYFRNNRWGWLAEAQGRFVLTFEHPFAKGVKLPSLKSLKVGQTIELPGIGHLSIAEIGESKTIGAEGEIPYRLVPNTRHRFVDLQGPNGVFGTLDYTESKPVLYLGKEVTLDELGIAITAKAPEKELKKVAGLQVNCPHCAGALELRAPDETLRVTCPSCSALLDADRGKLQYLSTLKKGKHKPLIPIGTVGTLHDAEYTVIGYVRRSVTYDKQYFWSEYLLYNPRIGYRWLVHSDGHWSFTESLSIGSVSGPGGETVSCNGETYKIFQRTKATVRQVWGEFYWRVAIGEQVQMQDYICPPHSITFEESQPVFETQGMHKGELNCSLSTYLPHAEVEKAFGLEPLRRGWVVAPNQPFPYQNIYDLWTLMSALIVLVGVFSFLTAPGRRVYEENFEFGGVNPTGEAQVVFSNQPLELHNYRNLRIRLRTSVDNSWVYVVGDLYNEETGLVQSFDLPVEYYHGYSGGESWSEGSRNRTRIITALPAGQYSLRVEGQTGGRVELVTLEIDEGVPLFRNFFMALFLVSILPGLIMARHHFFERSRWSESDFNPYASDD